VKSSKPLSLRTLNRATLARQLLLQRQKSKVVTVVERVAGLQAQVLKPFHKLDRRTRVALEEEGERLLRFVDPDAETYAV